MAFSAMRRVSRRSTSPDRIAVVMSSLRRWRRVTGSAPWAVMPRGDRSRSPGRAIRRVAVRSALRRTRVLLALRFLALPLHARLLVMLAAASLGEDAALLDLLVEATQGAFERLVLTHTDFCQSRFTSSGSGLAACRGARSHRRTTVLPRLGGRAAGA